MNLSIGEVTDGADESNIRYCLEGDKDLKLGTIIYPDVPLALETIYSAEKGSSVNSCAI